MKPSLRFLLPLCLLAPVGCPGDAPDSDLRLAPDLAEADMARPADMAPARCELPYDHRLINEVSPGEVTVTRVSESPLVYRATIDASAGGGAMAAQSRPYVYLDLIKAQKVAITDVQSRDSAAWDIAFKRWQIKINSGDSGPGGVSAAIVEGKALGEVAAAPASGFRVDDYLDQDCEVRTDPIFGLGTALSDWYLYENMRLSPKRDTIVLKRRDGMGHVKVQILDYYGMMRSGVFVIEWGFLP